MKKKKNVAKARHEPKELLPGKELCADALRMLERQDDIVSITYFKHFAQFNLINPDVKLIYVSMSEMYPLLNPEKFDYPHRSNIIGFKHIIKVKRELEGLLVNVMKHESLKVAKCNKVIFKIKYKKYLKTNDIQN